VLGEDDVALVVEYGECGDAMEIDAAALGDVEVGVDVANVDVDLDEVFGEELVVGGLVGVDVEDLAIAAPVAAEVDEDTLVLAVGQGDGGVEIVLGSGDFGVNVFGRGALGDGSCGEERSEEEGGEGLASCR